MGLENLKIGDWIQFRMKKGGQSIIGKVINFDYVFEEIEIVIDVKQTNGKIVKINEQTDFAKLPLPFNQKLDEVDNISIPEDGKSEVPQHYAGGEVDLIEYFYQQRGLDAMVVMTSFNIQRYASRLGRKDSMVSELNKIIDYAERLKEKLV